jgi:hypothetical protein
MFRPLTLPVILVALSACNPKTSKPATAPVPDVSIPEHCKDSLFKQLPHKGLFVYRWGGPEDTMTLSALGDYPELEGHCIDAPEVMFANKTEPESDFDDYCLAYSMHVGYRNHAGADSVKIKAHRKKLEHLYDNIDDLYRKIDQQTPEIMYGQHKIPAAIAWVLWSRRKDMDSVAPDLATERIHFFTGLREYFTLHSPAYAMPFDNKRINRMLNDLEVMADSYFYLSALMVLDSLYRRQPITAIESVDQPMTWFPVKPFNGRRDARFDRFLREPTSFIRWGGPEDTVTVSVKGFASRYPELLGVNITDPGTMYDYNQQRMPNDSTREEWSNSMGINTYYHWYGIAVGYRNYTAPNAAQLMRYREQLEYIYLDIVDLHAIIDGPGNAVGLNEIRGEARIAWMLYSQQAKIGKHNPALARKRTQFMAGLRKWATDHCPDPYDRSALKRTNRALENLELLITDDFCLAAAAYFAEEYS